MEKPSLRMGVSGHQHLGDETTREFVATTFRALLQSYQQAGYDVVLISAVAPGADQLFIRLALAASIPVELVIPCAEYEQSRSEYHSRLKQSRHIHTLPFQACSDDAYLAAGQWIV